MGKGMVEKVAMMLQESMNAQMANNGKCDFPTNARAALEACYFDEVVEALKTLHAWSRPFVERNSPISAETQWREFPKAIKKAAAALAKVEDQ